MLSRPVLNRPRTRPPTRARARSAAVAVIIAAVAVSGCALVKKKKPTLAYEERPVELLFSVGADYLDRHQWTEAVNYFNEVQRQHPYSEWSRRAILMTAYAHYEANSYTQAIADADQFIALYPGNRSTAYAYYLKAICYFEQIVDVNRDQAATEQAQLALGEVVKRYAGTEYALDAHLKLDMVSDQLAGKEMTVGRYYLRNGDPIAAIGRFQAVVDKFDTTSHTPEALYRLVACYLSLGLLREAVRDGEVLGYNYPGDYWYQQTYKMLTSKGLRPSVTPNGARGLPRFLPFGKHKETTVAPPAVEVVAAEDHAPVLAPGALPAPTDKAAKPVKPAKKGGLLHDVLGF